MNLEYQFLFTLGKDAYFPVYLFLTKALILDI